MSAMASESETVIKRTAVEFESIDTAFELDMLYQGQTHTVSTALDMSHGLHRSDIQASFESAYHNAYGRTLEGLPIRVVNLRVAVTGRRPKFDLSMLAPNGDATVEECVISTREVWCDTALVATPIYDRLKLPVGALVNGPAILEQSDSTTFLDADLQARVDALGNLVVERKA